jgi:hypothetical protein
LGLSRERERPARCFGKTKKTRARLSAEKHNIIGHRAFCKTPHSGRSARPLPLPNPGKRLISRREGRGPPRPREFYKRLHHYNCCRRHSRPRGCFINTQHMQGKRNTQKGGTNGLRFAELVGMKSQCRWTGQGYPDPEALARVRVRRMENGELQRGNEWVNPYH